MQVSEVAQLGTSYGYIILAGASVSYLAVRSPIEGAIRERVLEIYPKSGGVLLPLLVLILTISACTLAAYYVAQPIGSETQAFLAGLGCHATLTLYIQRVQDGLTKPTPTPSSGGETPVVASTVSPEELTSTDGKRNGR